jgi:hypothetical protein
MTVDNKKILSMVDFVVTVDKTAFMTIRYGPGSIVTRERPALAAARIIAQYQVPCTVVTNGEDAEVLDTLTGEVVGTGIASIPDKTAAQQQLSKIELQHLSPEQSDVEKRILSAYDWLEHSLECDDDWCAEE